MDESWWHRRRFHAMKPILRIPRRSPWPGRSLSRGPSLEHRFEMGPPFSDLDEACPVGMTRRDGSGCGIPRRPRFRRSGALLSWNLPRSGSWGVHRTAHFKSLVLPASRLTLTSLSKHAATRSIPLRFSWRCRDTAFIQQRVCAGCGCCCTTTMQVVHWYYTWTQFALYWYCSGARCHIGVAVVF